MGAKYSSLEELRRKKALLKTEVSDLEDLLTFDNTKESLSVLTHGYTDKFLTEKVDADGETKVSLNSGILIKKVTSYFISLIHSI